MFFTVLSETLDKIVFFPMYLNSRIPLFWASIEKLPKLSVTVCVLLSLDITVTSERYPFSSLTLPLTVLNTDALELLDWIVLKLINSFLEPFVIVFKKSVLYSLLLDITIRDALISGNFKS